LISEVNEINYKVDVFC